MDSVFGPVSGALSYLIFAHAGKSSVPEHFTQFSSAWLIQAFPDKNGFIAMI